MHVLFWMLAAQPRAWVLYALYTWSGVVVTLLIARFWVLVGEVFGTVGEAKRLYGPIVAGSVLRWFGCGFRLMRPLRSSAWMTSLIDCGVMNARRASCDVESGAPCRLSTLSVVNWSVVRPYGATRSLMLANSR